MSHAIASVFALAGAIVIVTLAGSPRTAAALAVYGIGLVALFSASGLYHRWSGPTRFKPLLQRIDHSTIYVFIAASYTPIALLLHGALTWIFLVVAWAGAAVGIGLRLGWTRAPRSAITGSYLVLGWIAVIAIPQLVAVLGAAPLILLAVGGVIYSAGAVV